MGSEELELALLTKANTRANSLVRKIDVSVSAASEESLPSGSTISPGHIISSSSSPPSRPISSFALKDSPSSPQYMADNELEDETGDEAGSESSQSSKNESPSLLPQPTMPKLDHHRKKRRRISHGLHEEQGNMHAEPVHSSQDVITGEISVSTLCYRADDLESSSSSLSSISLLSPSLNPSEQDGVQSSASTELYSPVLAPKKTVRFDESRNIIFGYDRGSTIALSQTSAKEACIKDDEDDEELEDMDYGSQLDDIGYGYGDGITDSVMSSPSRWIWSSANVSGASIEPIPSDLEATSTPCQPTLILHPDESGTNADIVSDGMVSEESNNSSFEFSQSSQLDTFMNIASSLDRMWSPSRATSAKRSSSTLSSVTSPSPLASTSRSSFNPHRIPTLKRQSSMSVIENADSSESSGRDTPNEQSPQIQCQGPSHKAADEDTEPTVTEEAAVTQAGVTGSSPDMLESQARQEDINMQEEPPLDALLQQVDRVRLMSPPPKISASDERRVVRGVIRSRDREGLGRSHAHPYRRRTPAAEGASAATASTTSGSSGPFVPPRLARASSFSVARPTARAPPILRREASTTALMDTLS
ncbi:hypothetical protein BGX31_007986 [Mortierella sp. GBA43]|nr:hypothetical protein BGX31_007986 [Mortierella sp. GBA43]